MSTLTATSNSPTCGRNMDQKKMTKRPSKGSKKEARGDSKRILSSSMKSSTRAGSRELKEVLRKAKVQAANRSREDQTRRANSTSAKVLAASKRAMSKQRKLISMARTFM